MGEQIEITPNPDLPLKAEMILMIIGADKALEKI